MLNNGAQLKIAIKQGGLKIHNEKVELIEQGTKDCYTVVIYDMNNNFLARGSMVQVENNLYGTCGSVARKGFGNLLYDTMAMVAEMKEIYICIDRYAAFVDAIDDIYSRIHSNKFAKSIAIDDKHSEDYFNLDRKDDFPHLFHGYQLPQTTIFKKSIVTYSKLIDKMLDDTKTYFYRSYEIESGNEWIDKELPIIYKVDRARSNELSV